MTAIAAVLLTFLAALPGASVAQSTVLMRCGASDGHAWYFHEPFWNPDASEWLEDGISDGQIVLVRLAEGWDIQFSDIGGGHGYRADGAEVVQLGAVGERLMVGAFHPNYVDIYTFDFGNDEVAWTSQKIGTPIPKVAAYHAECSG